MANIQWIGEADEPSKGTEEAASEEMIRKEFIIREAVGRQCLKIKSIIDCAEYC